ncbi:MAG: ABC transporter ATP-binding protein [Clostridia bacterium]|nr:ABC transporter ATP-binding protein [Clostridia bacterium]
MIRKLAKSLGEYKKYAILTPAAMIGEVLMEILIPVVMARIVNGVQQGEDVWTVVKWGFLMVVMAIFSLLCGGLAGAFAARGAAGFSKNLRNRLFKKVQAFSFSNVDKFSTASLVTRLTTDVNNVQNAYMMLIRSAIRSPFMLIGALFMALSINPRLSIVFLIAIPVLAGGAALIMTKAHPLFEKMLKKYDGLNASVQENLVGIRVVKAFVRERREIEKFEVSADEVRRAQVRAERLVVLNMPAMQLTMYLCTLSIVWFGGQMVIGGSFDVGGLTAFVSYIVQILMSLMMLSMLFITMIISMASARRICEVLDEEPDISDEGASPDLLPADGSIEFKNVNFSYLKDEEKLNLKDIDLVIHSGETIGIIGGTGSSKTSLVQLIPRLYDPMSGEVLVGGRNVKEYTLSNLRGEVAMVLQKNVLFSGTIRENLAWGKENATDEEIVEAAKCAAAHDFISSFPEGYDTVLGQGGVNLSGGQKQRLCIARALLKKPKIIILDDSTSAVDTATDAHIRAAFRSRLGDTTTLIIAQRITSVMDADRIIVMNDGEINGVGTHEQLLENNEIYREVYNSQQKGED